MLSPRSRWLVLLFTALALVVSTLGASAGTVIVWSIDGTPTSTYPNYLKPGDSVTVKFSYQSNPNDNDSTIAVARLLYNITELATTQAGVSDQLSTGTCTLSLPIL